MKKIITVIFTAILLVCLSPITASAEEGRITEDGTDEEALFDKLYESYGYGYSYKVHGDYMYISRIYKDYNYYGDFEDFGEETFTYTADYHRISLKTGEASKICDVYISSCFDIYGDYIYFVYNPQEYNDMQIQCCTCLLQH